MRLLSLSDLDSYRTTPAADDKSLTGEPIFPGQTANQYLARYWFAVCAGKIGSPVWPDTGSRFAPVKLVHRSEIYQRRLPGVRHKSIKGRHDYS
jgi:hypothetical protein